MLLSVFHDEVWLPSCANLRECTLVGYESAWRCHISDAFGGLEIDAITADMIETWMAGKPRGAARKAWGMSDVDVTTRVRGPKRTDHQPRVLDARQIATLLRGFWGHELEAWLICSVTLGLRPEEALGIEWSDTDLRGGMVRIRRGVQWVSGHEVVVEPKTDLPARSAMPFGNIIANTETEAEAKGLAIIRKPSASVLPMYVPDLICLTPSWSISDCSFECVRGAESLPERHDHRAFHPSALGEGHLVAGSQRYVGADSLDADSMQADA